MVMYPVGPFPPVAEPFKSFAEDVPSTITIKGKKFRLRMRPGEGINAAPFEAEELIDLTFPLGSGSGMVYGIIFQLGKWGYDTVKVFHAIDVSPVFTEYYQRTMEEKRKIEEQIKAGFASLITAITDFELLFHDVRKYKEYLNYYKRVNEAKKRLDKAKDKKEIEEAEKEFTEANHVLRALFVDYVDIHSGDGISMRSIAPRWPTIITDFMSITDEDEEAETIKKKLGISKAEAVILATKNKLFREWKSFFFDTVKGRYERLMMMASARKQSITEYRNQLKPLISRYKAFTESREIPDLRKIYERLAFYRPDAQAISLDHTEIWAWRPFLIPEIFKPPRESYEKVTFKEAGFYKLLDLASTPEEREKIRDKIKALEIAKRNQVHRLPALPIIDDPLIAIIAQIQNEYNVTISPEDIWEEIRNLSMRYGPPVRPQALKAGIRWPFSPYFVFVYMDVTRTVIKLPNGGILEDIWVEPLKTFNCTQNIILGRMLELRAKDIKSEREIAMLLGEEIDKEGKIMKIEDVLKEEYFEFYAAEKEKEEREKKRKQGISFGGFPNLGEGLSKIFSPITDLLNKLGIEVMFAYPGPYEKLMYERMSKMMQLGPGRAHGTISEYLKKAGGVPGAEPKVWI